jgi:enoyl-CoA hydratase/carnithine racemase
MADEPVVLHDKTKHVAYITLNRPDRLNAMTDEMLDAVLAGVRRAEEDDDIKAVVIKANGRAFSSGWDLEEIGRMYGIADVKPGERVKRVPQRNGLFLDRRRSEKFAAILMSSKTTICQVHGYCFGAAWMLALVCDFVIASDDATFAHTEQRLGASGTMWTLPLEILHCGPKKARELMLTGRDFSAEEAERLGLINKVVPAADLDGEVESWTKAISLLPRDGLAIGKAYTNMTYDLLRMLSPFMQYSAVHPLVVGMKWADDELSFPKERRDAGMKDAAHARAKRFDEHLG